MDNRLAILISDYQANVASAVDMMQRSGIPRPLTNTDWVVADIPQYILYYVAGDTIDIQ